MSRELPRPVTRKVALDHEVLLIPDERKGRLRLRRLRRGASAGLIGLAVLLLALSGLSAGTIVLVLELIGLEAAISAAAVLWWLGLGSLGSGFVAVGVWLSRFESWIRPDPLHVRIDANGLGIGGDRLPWREVDGWTVEPYPFTDESYVYALLIEVTGGAWYVGVGLEPEVLEAVGAYVDAHRARHLQVEEKVEREGLDALDALIGGVRRPD